MAELTFGSQVYSWDGELTEDTLIRITVNGRKGPTLPFASHIAHTHGAILTKFAEAGVLQGLTPSG